MTEDRLVFLGTKGGPAIRQGGAMPTASMLQLCGKTILIDCAIGAAKSTVEAGVSLLDIDAIFITHLHSDHVLELGPLIYTAWTTGMSRPMDVFGPKGIDEYWQGFLASMEFDQAIRLADEGRPPLGDLIKLHVIDDSFAASYGDIAVTVLKVDHPPVEECYALRFDGPKHSVVFSADTCYFPPLAEFARGADVLVHEAMLGKGIDKLVARTPNASRLREHLLAAHTMAGDVARIAAAADVGTLYLNHLVPADDPEISARDWEAEIATHWNGPVIVARDGLSVALTGA